MELSMREAAVCLKDTCRIIILPPNGISMRWASVEWGAAVARIYQSRALLPPTTCAATLIANGGNGASGLVVQPQPHLPRKVILPDLPLVVTPTLRQAFFDAIPVAHRVQTIAACHFASSRSLVSYVQQQQDTIRHVLIVGGNDKNGSSITSTEAIRALTTSAHYQDGDQDDKMIVWGVANPNCPFSVESVRAKVEAGATGFITQPLLSSRAMETLHRYSDVALVHSPDTTIIAGMAFPTSVQSLQFWNGLLDDTLSGDDEFERHVSYFAKHATTAPNDNGSTASTTWAVDHAQWISSKLMTDHGLCSGIHYMPMRNTRDWLAVLSKLDQQIDAL